MDPCHVTITGHSKVTLFMGHREKNMTWKCKFFFITLASVGLGRALGHWRNLSQLKCEYLPLDDLDPDDKIFAHHIEQLLGRGPIDLRKLWSGTWSKEAHLVLTVVGN